MLMKLNVVYSVRVNVVTRVPTEWFLVIIAVCVLLAYCMYVCCVNISDDNDLCKLILFLVLCEGALFYIEARAEGAIKLLPLLYDVRTVLIFVSSLINKMLK